VHSNITIEGGKKELEEEYKGTGEPLHWRRPNDAVPWPVQVQWNEEIQKKRKKAREKSTFCEKEGQKKKYEQKKSVRGQKINCLRKRPSFSRVGMR